MKLLEHYEKIGKMTDEEKAANVANVAMTIKKLLPSVEVEIVGLWIWVKETQKEMAPTLKENSFLWSPQKKAWYYAGKKAAFSRGKTLEEIKLNYGAVKV